ncbi:MAG: aminomethyltransferase family protein [Xanthomonadales bacterium]|nr:aminomethyltransferase family protein [Xanthomonadales bacterium]
MSVAGKPVSERVLRTAFYSRTSEANLLNKWHSWRGYTTADAYYDASIEYFACRNATGVFDLCPMTKYRITGPDALAYLDRLVTRDMTRIKPGRVAYAVWCNDAGKVIDDGTIFHLSQGEYRLCAYGRHLAWLLAATLGFDVSVEEETDEIAALAVQGPTSCAILKDMGLDGIENLKPFGLTHFDHGQLMVSRTGFTGDLGYELWVERRFAENLWDRLFEAGRLRGIRAMGGDALDMARIEAGFLQAEVDFLPADQVVRPGRARSPYELGLGWLVDLEKANFNGRRALAREKAEGSSVWQMVKLVIEGNKPADASYIYAGTRKQVGFVTSAMWSPVAKQNIALATVKAPYGNNESNLHAEIYYQRELHWSRVMARCEVVDKPFWDPPRRRATPPADY